MTPIEYCLRESVTHAKTMPLGECLTYLTGMMELAKASTHAEIVRHAFNTVKECDQQLELIASGQLTLSLPPATPAKKGSRK